MNKGSIGIELKGSEIKDSRTVFSLCCAAQ
jgi:hypothetical protein